MIDKNKKNSIANDSWYAFLREAKETNKKVKEALKKKKSGGFTKKQKEQLTLLFKTGKIEEEKEINL